jgi:hypothetical protein
MSTTTVESQDLEQPTNSPTAGASRPSDEQPDDTVAIHRRTIDKVLIGFGVVATMAFLVAGSLLLWGNQFSSDYVGDELASQNISFPPAESLEEEGRTDLLDFAGESVDTGADAEAYASFINGHLEGIADGATYADLGTIEREAKAAVAAAVDAGEPQATIDELQAEADGVTAQRDSLFRGETLRGLLLSAYAWSTVGMIAGIAAIGAFLAAAVMGILVVLGIVHLRRRPAAA